MYLLNLEQAPTTPEASGFTFHYVSIKSNTNTDDTEV